jgi:hypothetical protein
MATADYRGGYKIFNTIGQYMDFTGIAATTAITGRQRFVFLIQSMMMVLVNMLLIQMLQLMMPTLISGQVCTEASEQTMW